jgi:lipoprotein-anchoring transpeptidase ErfK/SrfK
MKKISRAAGAIILLTLILCGGGCVNETSNTAQTNSNSQPAPVAPSPAPTQVAASDTNNLPVTLPVLDAFFADDSFASELKSKLQLTDEQISNLRSIAREETAKLRETDNDDYSGTTASAVRLANERIKTAIGEEKSAQLAALVRERWNGEAAANGAANQGASSNPSLAHGAGGKPNAIPTDTRIVVNAPAYRMDVFEGGQLIKSYKIGIGYPEFPLPSGLRKASTIIFNPTWTPPDSPWVETSNKVKPGEKVEAGSRLNPLGLAKIPIGLPSLIHGGKSAAKLGGFASHGCVGLTDPQIQDFSKLLGRIGGAEITDEQIAGYAKNRTETKEVKLTNAVPVELRYETIVVEDGKLHIYRDVYDRDTNTEENLRAVLGNYGVTLEQLSEQERTQVTEALKEMSRDATGKSDEAKPDANSNASPGASSNKNANSNTSNKNENKGGAAPKAGDKVTRTVKGRKEIIVEIAALKGKGYPAPVDLNPGGQKTEAKSSKPAADKRR